MPRERLGSAVLVRTKALRGGLDVVGRHVAEHAACRTKLPKITEKLVQGRGHRETSQIVRGYVVASGTGKVGAAHALRHAMATAMLEGGADIRFIAAMLGNSDLATTQIYTQVGIRQLQRVHEMTHPAAMLRPSKVKRRQDIEGVRQAAVERDELHALVGDDDDHDTDD